MAQTPPGFQCVESGFEFVFLRCSTHSLIVLLLGYQSRHSPPSDSWRAPLASPIARQASENPRKTRFLFHRVVGKKIIDPANLSILGVMRWNLLFDELEYGFEELLAGHTSVTPKQSNTLPNPLEQLLLGAKSAKSAVLIRDVRGGEYWLSPRAVGRDWVSGRLAGGGERILLLDAIVAIHEGQQCRDEQATLAPISFAGLLQIWKNRGDDIGVETRADNFVGQLSDVFDQGVAIRSTRVGKPATWFIPFRHVVSVIGGGDNDSL